MGTPRMVNDRSRNAERMKRWRADNPRAARDLRLRRLFGITADEYDQTLTGQGGGCAICGTRTPGGKGAFPVDHDHSCCPGKKSCGSCVRGLLCNRCNVLLGMAQDDIAVLESAINYLNGAKCSRIQISDAVAEAAA